LGVRLVMLSGPATLMGSYLRALARKESDTRERIREDLIRTGWEGATGVIDGAFLEAVALKFDSKTTLRDLSRFSERMLRHYRATTLSAKDVETMLRWGLGEQIPVNDVPSKAAEAIKMLVFAAVADDRRLTASDLDDLLARAERYAYTSGFRPTTIESP
jgi:hypothetical protein